MKNDQTLGFKARNSLNDFQNNKFKVDTKETERFPTMTNTYGITGHVARRGAKSKQIGLNLRDSFLSIYISKISRLCP